MIKKVKRGYYTLEYKIVSRDASMSAEGEITKKQTRILEELICEDPQFWLWSHKRWKHKRHSSNDIIPVNE